MKELLLVYAPSILLWLAVAYKLPSWYRRPHDSGRRYLVLTLLFLALALTVLIPGVYVGIDRVLGIPNFSRLLSNSLTLVDCWMLLALLAHLGGGTKRSVADLRRAGWLLLLALVVMAGLFLTAPVPREALDFAQRYAGAAHVLEYRLVYLLYLALAELTLARLAWRYAAIADHPSLRLGLRVLAAGGIAGLAYVINDGGFLILRRLDLPYPFTNSTVIDQVLVAVALALGVVGSTMPTWGPRLGIPRLYGWALDYRSLRRLYPLWSALYRVNPEIAFDAPQSALVGTFSPSDVSFRLYRRVVEIRDGWLALRPYFEPQVSAFARQLCHDAGLAGNDADAVIEAASLAAAISAKASGITSEGVSDQSVPFVGGADLAAEIAKLERVSHNFEHSPIVRSVRARIEQQRARAAEGQIVVAEDS